MKTKMITINIPIKMHELAKQKKVNMSEVSRIAIQIAIEQADNLKLKIRG